MPVNLVANKSSVLLNNAKKQGVFNCEPSSSDTLRRNEDARNLSVIFYKENSDEQNKTFHGANNQEFPIIVSHGEKKYVFPPRCMFFNNDISNLNQKLDVLGKFDLLLLDPPWWNKYIRRKKQKSRESSYSMMYDEDLLKLPVASLIAPGALVAVWCTNSETHINTMKNKIFPSWGIECVSKWYWLKVTRSGIPVCNFSEPPNKQPFEQILFAHQLCTPRSFPLPEDGKIVISIPSAIHSHKPPLTELSHMQSKCILLNEFQGRVEPVGSIMKTLINSKKYCQHICQIMPSVLSSLQDTCYLDGLAGEMKS
ncbi:N(6)-adenine-specific methyltransferase METTL4 isoform X3 [Schistocerca gregaria]|uniref:N(6)-adenine-specific methyltransferase METTL4 isoform X3 n=1 Tax=Schistocerca gregaria TaxID=7010 RepID=UPI00211E8A78|nr:N(6)-adenine-specific methyltransferase METTL4 isoform X3 [Schistocerca gregaria]